MVDEPGLRGICERVGQLELDFREPKVLDDWVLEARKPRDARPIAQAAGVM